MPKVKICGITNLEDAINAAKLGADYLGFNFYKKSPRYIDEKKAKKIIEKMPNNVKKVGIFVNEELNNVADIANKLNLDLVQLHGDEKPEYCKQLKDKSKKSIIKAFRIKNSRDIKNMERYNADFLMFDAHKEGMFGGTGKTFDWKIIKAVKRPFFLSGGLNPENAGEAIKIAKPFAVDVASGVEENPRKKDYNKMKDFIEAVK
ncbi:MAG: phosphoribosylanthranilate isomerase [Nanoarchaeota archaeon]|mgnify:FL=1